MDMEERLYVPALPSVFTSSCLTEMPSSPSWFMAEMRSTRSSLFFLMNSSTTLSTCCFASSDFASDLIASTRMSRISSSISSLVFSWRSMSVDSSWITSTSAHERVSSSQAKPSPHRQSMQQVEVDSPGSHLPFPQAAQSALHDSGFSGYSQTPSPHTTVSIHVINSFSQSEPEGQPQSAQQESCVSSPWQTPSPQKPQSFMHDFASSPDSHSPFPHSVDEMQMFATVSQLWSVGQPQSLQQESMDSSSVHTPLPQGGGWYTGSGSSGVGSVGAGVGSGVGAGAGALPPPHPNAVKSMGSVCWVLSSTSLSMTDENVKVSPDFSYLTFSALLSSRVASRL